MTERGKGSFTLFLGYCMWGLHPLYWKLLEHVPSSEILAHRVIWSVAFTLLILLVQGKLSATLRFAVSNPRTVRYLVLSGYLVAGNWFLFIWAVNHGRILETSLGYFINPLMNMFLGVVLFHEKINAMQRGAIVLAVAGVAVQVAIARALPLISLGIATSFVIYGVIRKRVAIDPTMGLFIETLSVAPIALLWLFYAGKSGISAFPYDLWSNCLLVGTGAVASVPLICFAFSVSRVPLSTVGFLQFVSPTLTFLIGVFVYCEPLSTSKLYTFALIWVALLLYAADAIMTARKTNASNG